MKAKELYHEGRLKESIAAITEEVKRHPTNIDYRSFLCELLLISGQLERADKQLDFIGHQDPSVMAGVALWRQLIRAEEARKQFFTEGRLPEFLEKPDVQIEQYLQASIFLRDKDMTEAQRLLEEAEESRIPLTGDCNENMFDDFRDLDDLTANVFEVLTSNGKYYWIPYSCITELRFYAPERSIDLTWRRASLVVELPGADGDVYIPTTYFSNVENLDDKYLLAQETEWLGEENEPVRGVGQKTFLVGEEAIPVMELKKITFNK